MRQHRYLSNKEKMNYFIDDLMDKCENGLLINQEEKEILAGHMVMEESKYDQYNFLVEGDKESSLPAIIARWAIDRTKDNEEIMHAALLECLTENYHERINCIDSDIKENLISMHHEALLEAGIKPKYSTPEDLYGSIKTI